MRWFVLVEGKCSPERGCLNRALVVVVSIVLQPMEPHLDRKTDALTGIVPALRVAAAASLPDGHDSEGLDRRQVMVVLFLVKQPLGLLEEVVARRVGVVGVRARARPAGKPAAQSKERVDQDGRAESGASVGEVVEKVLLAQ